METSEDDHFLSYKPTNASVHLLVYMIVINCSVQDAKCKNDQIMIKKCSVQNHNKQTTFIQSNTTQIYFNSVDNPYMYAACFGLYLGHPQTESIQQQHEGRYNKT